MKINLTKNLGLKIVSVIVAFLLWLVVVSVDDPITSRNFTQIPVELTNTDTILSRGEVYEILDDSDVVSISVTAKRSVLDSLSRDNFKATADMSKLDGSDIPIEVRATKYADRIENISLKNRNIKVAIEGMKEIQLAIQTTTIGNVAEGYVLGEMILDRNVVRVSGPESKVNEISSAVATVDVSGMTSNISTAENIFLLDESGNEVVDSDLNLNVTSVNVKVEIWSTKIVPISCGYIGTPAEGFVISRVAVTSPDAVVIAGQSDKLSKIGAITIPDAAVDVTGVSGDYDIAVDIESYLPDGVVLTSEFANKAANIHVSVMPFATKTVPVPLSNITVSNVPEGMVATVGGLGEVVAVEVRGLGEAYDNLDPTTIVGNIDASSVPVDAETESVVPDVYDLPVSFTYPTGILGGDNEIIAKVLIQVENGE